MSSDTRDQYDQVLFPNYSPLLIIPDRGEGARLWDTEGREYIDFAAGIAVSALGHAHPALIEALTKQAKKFWHVSNLMATAPAVELAQQLVDCTFAERVLFANSGAEANEGALKLARRYAVDHFGEQKNQIIAFDQAFHGRTFFTVSVGGQAKYSDGFGPKPGGITHLPFNDVAALKAAVSDQTCAVIMEPIQGEGGVNPASQDFVAAARSLCDEHHALLIFDEIQTGVMRTGSMYRYQALGVEPDILTTAKGLGGGFPIAAMLAKADVAKSLGVGTHGGTYAGNPMGCAVASEVLKIVDTDEMKSRVNEVSEQLRTGLEAINQEFKLFSDIRGFGLLIGCELKPEYHENARELVTLLMAEGLLALVAGPNVLRLAPPLILSDKDMKEGLAILRQAVSQFVA